VSTPATLAFDQALDGRFAPGSTFKVIDSSALFSAGLTPASPVSCSPTITVNGQVFHNAEGDGKASNILQAFAESCNTAFIGLVDNHLSAASLQAAARAYGLGTDPKIGLNAATASVPVSPGANGLAAAAIGQGQVLVSPLNLATVAAAVDSGVVRQPRLVVGAPDDTAPTSKLPAAVVAQLQQMMAAVVVSGTAANTGLPAGTHAKTGTAEYGSGTPPPTDAWLMGYDGGIAFAVVVQGTGNGGPTDGPIIAKFLRALGSAA
jgi:cell division protein FtsI/penicillin-binding protein 2